MNNPAILKQIKTCVSGFKNLNILVFGDTILDVYLHGEVKRISPEAPVPILNTKQIEYRLGGGGNVACNLSNMGVNVTLLSVIGKDKDGEHLLDYMKKLNLPTQGMLATSRRKTSVKTRVIAQNQQIVRIDNEDTHVLEENLVDQLIKKIVSFPQPIDGIIISDYGKGVVNNKSLDKLINFTKSQNIFTALDPKQRNFSFYRGIDVMTPNHYEAAEDIGKNCESFEEVRSAGMELIAKHDLRQLIITRGEKGLTLFDRYPKKGRRLTQNRDSIWVSNLPTFNRSLYDVSGAGDTVIALYTAAYLTSRDSYLASIVANISAGIVVSHFGTSPVNMEDFNIEITNRHLLNKITRGESTWIKKE